MRMVILICMSTYLASSTIVSDNADDDEYGIILDGGSSGTKLKIYVWKRWLATPPGSGYGFDSAVVKNDIRLVESIKFEPGVSALVHSLNTLNSYFDNIVTTAKNKVPAVNHEQTPIYFLATAGLRTLSINDTENLVEAIEQYLKSESCPFLTPENNVRVLSGEEEAVYAWVAANYLRGFFWSNKPSSEAVGVLEMGGGSTQIAFLPEYSVYANMFPVRIGGVTYHLYSHSYLLYGQNYIVSRINDYLVAKASGNQVVVENPCMLKGDNTSIISAGESVHIKGTANTTKCLEIIDIFLKTADDNWCYPKPCAIGATYQPPVMDTVFYAIAAFVYAPTYLNASDDKGRLDISALKSNALKYCSKRLDEVVSSGLPAQFASSYCIMGLYIPSLLLDAYDFNVERNPVYVRSSINGVDIDWSLGAMLMFIETYDDTCSSSATISLLPVVRYMMGACVTIVYLIFK